MEGDDDVGDLAEDVGGADDVADGVDEAGNVVEDED